MDLADPLSLMMGALAAVTGSLVWSVKILFRRSQECEREHRASQLENAKLQREIGEVKGMLTVMAACPNKECPIPYAMRTSFFSAKLKPLEPQPEDHP